ncbi:HEAT repeat domain-containing protein [Streptomyces sp. NPDC001705]
MIESAEEFIRLRFSDAPEDYGRASTEPAAPGVWRDVIESHPEARFWVAQNKTVPLEILQVLASDSDPRVRSMVASKRKLTPDVLTTLASDSDESVRLAVARHKSIPRAVLELLRSDKWEEIRNVARDRLDSSQ